MPEQTPSALYNCFHRLGEIYLCLAIQADKRKLQNLLAYVLAWKPQNSVPLENTDSSEICLPVWKCHKVAWTFDDQDAGLLGIVSQISVTVISDLEFQILEPDSLQAVGLLLELDCSFWGREGQLCCTGAMIVIRRYHVEALNSSSVNLVEDFAYMD